MSSVSAEWRNDVGLLVEELNKKYGEGTVVFASQTIIPLRRFSTGCAALDISLGGGFVENRITEIRGHYSTYKSTVTLTGAKAFLNKYPDDGLVAYVDAERTWDPKYATKLGLPVDRIILVNPDSGEQAVDVIRELLDLKINFLMIVDSIAALVPAKEIEDPVEQQNMALQARLINKMMRIVVSRMKRAYYNAQCPSVTILALNQLRSKVGLIFGSPETTPGGMGKDFYYSVMIRMATTKGEGIGKEVTRNGVKRYVRFGQTVSFAISKNKTGGAQHENGEMDFYERPHEDNQAFAFDNVKSLFEYGLFHNVITLNGKMMRVPTETGFISGKPSFVRKKLLESPKWQRYLKRAIIEARSKETAR